MRVHIRGAVQGVGFRPYVYRLATDLQLQGWVRNSATGLTIEAEGSQDILRVFLSRLREEYPAHAVIQSCEAEWLPAAGHTAFVIQQSEGGRKIALILPDLGTCPACLAEIRDPANRRYRYPFTNCTHCGPRFSIIEALPYDRPHTTMKRFRMCPDCRHEYEDPDDRRFHAQPNACPVCGPQLAWWNADGAILATRDDALRRAVSAVRLGQIVAVKGLGGFHLICDARDENAVRLLRERKSREEKPFALMLPDLATVRQLCEASDEEEASLTSQIAPILLLRRLREPSRDLNIAASVAPANPNLGVMLPYTPLHHLLLADLGFPLVATSGNLSDEPICTDEHEALQRLAGIADFFLVHNRPLARHVDDSIVRFMANREQILRRARGYAPLPVSLPTAVPTLLAVGGHLKNTIALSVGADVFLSQHIGDLETQQASAAFQEVIDHFQTVYEHAPVATACDAHPGYLSTRYARRVGNRTIPVQHHLAHVLACQTENGLDPPLLGVAWDGTGYGLDGTIWGGEFIVVTATEWQRFASFRTFPLPGGERAVREPRRTALGLLHEMVGPHILSRQELAPVAAFAPRERGLLGAMLERGINCPLTSSAGRLFDAACALLGVCQIMSFEGQAAMELEFLLEGIAEEPAYPVCFQRSAETESDRGRSPGFSTGVLRLDWEPLFQALLADVREGVAPGAIAKRFHNALSEAVVMVAERAAIQQVVLTGGCFQNCYLLERSLARLRQKGFVPCWHAQVPPNDGGIALGQIVAAASGLAHATQRT